MSENAGTDRDESERAATGDESEGDDTGASAETTEDGDGTDETDQPDSELVARVAAHDEELAADVAAVERRAEESENRVEELESKLARNRAEFENYKKRAKKRQEQIEETATADLVERLTEVRNNLLRALDQDEGEDIRPGVESTLETFDRVLDEEGVTPIEPDPGTEVDPQRHEVMMRVESDQPADTIASVFRPGYEMADQVIEAAQVTVSEGTGDGDDETSE
jgi:molecular chaperone GrpE